MYIGKREYQKENGYTFLTDLEGRVTNGCTWMCVHCNAHHNVEPGSGKLRGYCTRCDGFVCPGCADACVPLEQMLENLEAGMTLDQAMRYRPVVVPFTGVKLPKG